jgi:hypothetical protein
LDATLRIPPRHAAGLAFVGHSGNLVIPNILFKR